MSDVRRVEQEKLLFLVDGRPSLVCSSSPREPKVDWFIKAFIRASLIWFTLGIALGLAMAAHPLWVVYRPAHAHMNVVGFITMMIFGVGYQLLPRLFGGGLWSRRLAIAHLWFANIGLALMVIGFMLTP